MGRNDPLERGRTDWGRAKPLEIGADEVAIAGVGEGVLEHHLPDG